MPVKGKEQLITPEMVELWRRGLSIEDEGGDKRWEHEGGRNGEYIEIRRALAGLLGRTKPWLVNVFDFDPDDVPTRPLWEGLSNDVAARFTKATWMWRSCAQRTCMLKRRASHAAAQ